MFFGPVAVCSSFYLQTFTLTAGVAVAATMVGLPAVAVLAVNNYRDLEPDARLAAVAGNLQRLSLEYRRSVRRARCRT